MIVHVLMHLLFVNSTITVVTRDHKNIAFFIIMISWSYAQKLVCWVQVEAAELVTKLDITIFF